MPTVADLASTIRTMLQRPELTDADTYKAINLVKRELQKVVDSWYQERSSQFSTVIGTKQYTMPTDWRDPKVLWYISPTTNTRVIMEHVDRPFHAFFYPDDTKQQEPRAYHVIDRLLTLDPTPNAVITINRDYISFLPDYAVATDTDLFASNCETALIMGACQMLSINLGSWANVKEFERLFDKAQGKERKVQTGHVEGARRVRLPARGAFLPRA